MDESLLITHAAQLVTVSGFEAKKGHQMSDLSIISDGALAIEGGIITHVGKTEHVLDELDASRFSVLDATGKAVLPGFVDAHTHFVFGGFRAEELSWRLGGMSYLEISERGGGFRDTVDSTRKAGRDDLVRAGRKILDRMLSFGVTTVEGKSGYGLDCDTEMKQLDVMEALNRTHAIDVVPTFLGAHTATASCAEKADDFIDYLISDVLPRVAKKGAARFCDVLCERGVFSIEQSRRLLTAARSLGLELKLHADATTQLGGAELAADLGAVSADHLLYASDAGIGEMVRRDVVAVLLPATAFSLREPYPRARFMINNGCAVALATDFNPGSSFSESIPLAFALATLYMEMTPEEAITAFTLNGAAALGRADKIGSLDAGKQGDVIVLEFPSYLFIPYHMAVNCVEKVIKNGKVVVGRRIERRGT